MLFQIELGTCFIKYDVSKNEITNHQFTAVTVAKSEEVEIEEDFSLTPGAFTLFSEAC